jgi:hypothetical protein
MTKHDRFSAFAVIKFENDEFLRLVNLDIFDLEKKEEMDIHRGQDGGH